MKKKKGHYCRVCGLYKLEKDFCDNTGYGYFICKKCKAAPFSPTTMSVLSELTDMQHNRLSKEVYGPGYWFLMASPQHHKSSRQYYGMSYYEMYAATRVWESFMIYHWRAYGFFPPRSDFDENVFLWKHSIERDLCCKINCNRELRHGLYRRLKNISSGINKMVRLGQYDVSAHQPVKEGEERQDTDEPAHGAEDGFEDTPCQEDDG